MEEREKKRPRVFLLAEGHPAERWLQAQLDPLPWLDSLSHTHTHTLTWDVCHPGRTSASFSYTHMAESLQPADFLLHTHRHSQTHLTARELPVRPETTLIMSAPPPPTGTASAVCDEKANVCLCVGDMSRMGWEWRTYHGIRRFLCAPLYGTELNRRTQQCILARWAWVLEFSLWKDGIFYMKLEMCEMIQI